MFALTLNSAPLETERVCASICFHYVTNQDAWHGKSLLVEPMSEKALRRKIDNT